MKIHQICLFLISLFIFSANAQKETAETVIDKFNKLHSGKDKIKSVTAWKFNTVSSNPMQKSEVPTVIYFKGNKFRIEQTFAGKKEVMGTDGKNYWVQGSMGNGKAQPMPDNMIPAMKEQIARQKDALTVGPLSEYKTRKKSVQLMGLEKINNRNHYKIKMVTKTNITLIFYIDKETYYLNRIESQLGDKDKKELLKVNFAEQKKVGDFTIPHKIDQYLGANQISSVKISTVELNPKLDDTLFSFPKK